MEGYQIREVFPGVTVITEESVHMYLVQGRKKALLIDTGFGRGDLKGLIGRLTDTPLIVANTHGHIDHVGGNTLFEAVYANQAEWERITAFSGMPVQRLIPLCEGDCIDLGGRQLEILELPGHTPGSVALFDRENRILFSGDYVSDRTVYLCFDHCSLRDYAESLKRILSMKLEVDVLFGGHGAANQSLSQAKELLVCVEAVMEGKLDSTPVTVFDGTTHPMYALGGASIFG